MAIDKKVIGSYIINEGNMGPMETKLTPKLMNGKVVAEGILQTADERNRNGRFYSHEDLFPQLSAPRTVELLEAGYMRAEMGHPLSKDLQRQSTIDDTKTCARFLRFWTQGNDVWGRFVATNNVNGAAFNQDLLEGCRPAWSLRALGSIHQTNRGAEVRNLRLITYDNVIYPSHPGAYTQRIVYESANIQEDAAVTESGIIIPLHNNDIVNYLESESGNLKFVKECFDYVYKDIAVNPQGTVVTLTLENGDAIKVNIENYIHDELMNYASSMKD